MNNQTERLLSFLEVISFPAFVLWFIWRLQFTERWTWIFFALWLAASFAIHRDTPKTLGWRVDNFWRASKQAIIVLGAFALGLIGIGFLLHAPRNFPRSVFSAFRIWGYFAFCLLQQLALNSLIHNRMLSIVRNEWTAATLTGAIFAACHWPNPVLVPLTFIGGAAMAWMFGRVRNILPLAIGQAVLGTLASWAFPLAWHHHLRVGPGYYGSRG